MFLLMGNLIIFFSNKLIEESDKRNSHLGFGLIKCCIFHGKKNSHFLILATIVVPTRVVSWVSEFMGLFNYHPWGANVEPQNW